MGPDRARLCRGRGKPVRGGGRGTLYATTQRVYLVDQLWSKEEIFLRV